jgi:hypothetical protein
VSDSPGQPDRYEPLPGIAELPGWVWRKIGRGGRIALGIALLVVVGLAVATVPRLKDAEQQRNAADQRERAERRTELASALEVEMRPRFGRSEPAPTLAARADTVDAVDAAILRDARARVRSGELDGPIRRLQCEPFPRSPDAVGADEDLSRRRGRYACVAVTAEFEGNEAGPGGIIGHRYRALVDFGTGRYAFCKVTGQSGPSREQLATTPRACGG